MYIVKKIYTNLYLTNYSLHIILNNDIVTLMCTRKIAVKILLKR